MQPTSSVIVFILIALKCVVYGEIVGEGSGLLKVKDLEYNDGGMEYDESSLSKSSESTESEPSSVLSVSSVADQRRSILKSGRASDLTRKSVRIEEPKAERELGFPDEFNYDDDYFVQAAAQQKAARQSAAGQTELPNARRSTPQFLKAVQQQSQANVQNQANVLNQANVQRQSVQQVNQQSQRVSAAPAAVGPLQFRQSQGAQSAQTVFEIPEVKHFTAPEVQDRQSKMMRTRQSFLQTEGDDVTQGAVLNRKSMIKPPSSQSPQSRQSTSQAIQSTVQARQSTFPSSRKSAFQPSPSPKSATVSDLSGVKLGFCDTAALALVVNIRLLGVKFPRQSSSSERAKMSLYISNMISNFPCDQERDLMNEALKAMPAIYSDRTSFTRWAEIFSKRVLKGINSPVAINLGNVLVPTKVYKNNRKTKK